MLICPECDEKILLDEDDLELNARVVCEACYALIEIINLDPVTLKVVDVDLDDLEDDDFDDEELEDDPEY